MKITGFAPPQPSNLPAEFGWDQETGLPSISFFGNALQCWSQCQDRPVTVAEAALTFNVSPDLIRQAVEKHPWMVIEAMARGEFIEHEGE